MYDLSRFKKAQESDYQTALQEAKSGRKTSHWIWYIFPQMKGLAFSGMSDKKQLKIHDICGLLYLGLICSALCYLMWNEAIAGIGAMKANIYVYAVPVVTMIAGAIFLHEVITWGGAVGVMLVAGGMLLSSLNRSKRKALG